MKFNLIISNPPYTNNLDLKILKTIYELGEKVCFIHPGSWAYSNKPNMSKLYKHIKKFNVTYFKKVDDANSLFNIGIFTTICISIFNKKCKNPIDINEIDIHGNSKIYKSLKKKILKYCEKNNILMYINYNKNKKYTVEHKKWQIGLPEFAPSGRDVFIQKTDETMQYGKNTKYVSQLFFDTKTEVLNAKNFLKNKLTRFCLSVYKINQCLHAGSGSSELASVPYMPTYKHKWTDEMVAKELGLTDDELAWAINWVPDYYPEDAEKYKKYEV